MSMSGTRPEDESDMGREGYDSSVTASPEGMSPDATGGGGVTFERKVAAMYLARLLVDDAAAGLGDGQQVVSVAFQQAPAHPVDDLVVHAQRPEDLEPSVVLALGVRRSVNLVASDERAQRLISQFVDAVISAPAEGPENRLGLVVAGSSPHADQLGVLAGVAAGQMDARGFFDLVQTPRKFNSKIRGRLDHFRRLVAHALGDPGVAESDAAVVELRAWQVLSRLSVMMMRLESPDETDWSDLANKLIPVARGCDLEGSLRLRDRLVALASEYSPKAARVDLKMLRRDAHLTLDVTARRNQQGWQRLGHLQQVALSSVSDEIGRRMRLSRSSEEALLLSTATESTAMIVSGESGVGKSALVLRSLTTVAEADPDSMQVVCVNLRQVPVLTVELESMLGCPLSMLLAELSAPKRFLVVDGADAVAEDRYDAFCYLVDAAHNSGVGLVAVTSVNSKQIVSDTLDSRFGADVAEQTVPLLSDREVNGICETFTELESLTNPRSRELLRRLVVVDLLVRGRLSGVPLTDADAMHEVWQGLVRRYERADRGSPHERELALVRLANHELSGRKDLDILAGFDQTALDGLHRDGLLRTSSDDPFRIGPEFTHDEIRRYAVARLLLADGDPASRLLEDDAPRWALGAARLACQKLLSEPDTATTPLRGRFATLQASFDKLVEQGHGTRWGDVPGEAMLTLADAGPMLRDIWPELSPDANDGRPRIGRLLNQRLRDEGGFVKINAVEPVIALLLDEDTPWRSGEYALDLLKAWLHAHVMAATPAGNSLRITFRERLQTECQNGDRRLAETKRAASAASAARSQADIERERRISKMNKIFFSEIGVGGQRRRARPEVPREITDEDFLELLALLGTDLGEGGEEILRRVARDAPWNLYAALERLLTDHALARCRRGLLAELTEAYYLDDETRGSSIFEDGIRDHRPRGLYDMVPQAAWHHGPFMMLFQSDFLNGVAMLNRLLNHAALIRARTLNGLNHGSPPSQSDPLDAYSHDLEITGERRRYVGDAHVWAWYRGTGVGPYPCMSALQALERVCDMLIAAGTPIRNLISILLQGCDNLAMVGLVVGILVRHLENTDNLLDPYLAEPLIWDHEFGRVVSETGGFAADSEGLVEPERRQWTLRDAASVLVLGAEDERVAELRTVGETLVTNARRQNDSTRGGTIAPRADADDLEHRLITVRGWAATLDRDRFHVTEVSDDHYQIGVTPPEDVVEALQDGQEDLRRAQQDIRLNVRYHVHLATGRHEPIAPDEIVADIAVARELFENPPELSAHSPWDAPALVAAAALEAHLVDGVDLPDEAATFAAEIVLRIGEGDTPPRPYEFKGTYYEQGADRSAARVVPLLLLPAAARLRSIVDQATGGDAFERATAASLNLSMAGANETRLYLARGLDQLWMSPCAETGPCHHDLGLRIATDTMRYCIVGPWNPDTEQRMVAALEGSVIKALANADAESILVDRLDAAIRALAPAAICDICISRNARALLEALLDAQRRSLLAHEKHFDHRGTHTLVSARALLTLAQQGDHAPIHTHLNAYASDSIRLDSLLRALLAAAEETPERAATARRVWPGIIDRVLELHDSSHTPFEDPHFGDRALADLIPNATHEIAFLYRELKGEPIVWWSPLELRDEVQAWLVHAAGNPECADQLVSFLGSLAPEDQAQTGLPWVATLVLADPARIASRSWSLSTWLIGLRPAAVQDGSDGVWQQIVDALVVAGVTSLAPYSD